MKIHGQHQYLQQDPHLLGSIQHWLEVFLGDELLLLCLTQSQAKAKLQQGKE